MLRRPPTSIELKLEDIKEYENMRQQMAKDQEKQSGPFGESPSWQPGPRSKEEVYSRIGYIPDKQEVYSRMGHASEKPSIPSRPPNLL